MISQLPTYVRYFNTFILSSFQKELGLIPHFVTNPAWLHGGSKPRSPEGSNDTIETEMAIDVYTYVLRATETRVARENNRDHAVAQTGRSHKGLVIELRRARGGTELFVIFRTSTYT